MNKSSRLMIHNKIEQPNRGELSTTCHLIQIQRTLSIKEILC